MLQRNVFGQYVLIKKLIMSTVSLCFYPVFTFPQGTTRPFAPGRVGIGHLIRQFRPIVVPVVVDGFSRAFGRTGLKFRNPGLPVSLVIKAPLALDDDAPAEVLVAQVMDAIEQSEAYRPGSSDAESSGEQRRA